MYKYAPFIRAGGGIYCVHLNTYKTASDEDDFELKEARKKCKEERKDFL